MESPIDELLEKYWAGKTSLLEEQQIRKHFKENPSLTSQGLYFRALEAARQQPMVKFTHPARKSRQARWSVAATIIIGVLAAVLILEDAKKQREFTVEDPQEAYEITRKALLMVSSGLNQGKVYSQEINHINKAEEMVRTDRSSTAH